MNRCNETNGKSFTSQCDGSVGGSDKSVERKKDDKKFPITLESKKVDFEKKSFDCKVIKVSA